jgi:HEAT repeat protein
MPNIGDAAPFVVRSLLCCLDENNDTCVSVAAAQVIGDLQSIPEVSIPALVRCLYSPRFEVRGVSAEALGQFGSIASNTIPNLTNALVDSEDYVRVRAVDALHQIDPVTFTNTPGIP